MLSISIDNESITELASVVRSLNFKTENFTSEEYYPPLSESIEIVSRYFLVMVSMDHRLSRPHRPFEAVIEGRSFHGADLLYKLGMVKYREDPEFYSPTRLSKVTVKEVREWLSVGDVSPIDLELRTRLLRDIGFKLLRLYSGKVVNLLERSKSKLRGGWGLIDRLKVFTAYQDPVEKKSFLLVKFLERRGIFKPVDLENLEVPVDNHLTRIALRLGIVEVRGELYDKIRSNVEVTPFEDYILRIMVREAYKKISINSRRNPLILDDFLWSFGRKYCKKDKPKCLNSGECIFQDCCKALTRKGEFLNEPNYYNTWYY